MRSIIYVTVATALISITPFLISFNPECVPYRGIFIYSILAILLFFTNVKAKCVKKIQKVFTFVGTYTIVCTISLIDTKEIVELLKLSTIFYLISFVTTAFSLLLLKNVKSISIKRINLILFTILFLHLVFTNTDVNQPLLTFTLISSSFI